jgi:3-oxoadipate enol-lactonase
MLHPVGVCAEFWDPVADYLQSDFRVIAIDTRGHGESDIPADPFTLDDAAQDVIELLRSLGRPPCALVGCSMGGMIAQGVVLNAPELISGLILSNTSHMRPPEARQALLQRAAVAENGMPDVLGTTLDRWFNDKFKATNPNVVARAADWLLAGDPMVHAWSWRAMADLAYGTRLSEIRCPALVLSGSEDQSIPLATSERLAAAISGARHIDFAGAGHLTPIECPEEYARVIREFLQGLPGLKATQA